MEDTATVGYCNMDESYCGDCWTYSLEWQGKLFEYMSTGDTVKEAFDKACDDYPVCCRGNSCMRVAGDEDFAVRPLVYADFYGNSGITPDFPDTDTPYPTQGYPDVTCFDFTDETTGGTEPLSYD